jgi:PKD repeat protein
MYYPYPTRVSKSVTFLFILFSLFTENIFAQNGNASPRGLARGQAAINKLSDRLPAVAQKYGKSPQGLRRLFLEDWTLHVDDTDSLLYVDDATEETQVIESTAPVTSAAAPYSYAQTFQLHSRPGSNRVIYLDFDGHITSNTAWNTNYTSGQPINSAPFSLDGNSNSFNTQEQDAIQYIWQRVAEDFAPFDVDVTTQDPGDDAIFRSASTDLIYGTRAVISPTNFTGSNIGGIAYVGVFNYVGSTYQPAFVMTSGLGNSEKNIAEATSHEVGHNLGLNHDGKTNADGTTTTYYAGHGDWAPIMGNSYYKSVTQWSKGEYSGANQLQDDLAVMQTYGIPLISDDHGNTNTAATVLSGININGSGLVTTRSDVDIFQFSTGEGNVTINLNPAARGANLDIQAQISDAQGNVVATANPLGLPASFNQSLSAGVYYLTIDGVGANDLTTGYSDYASIGQYSITGTLAASNAQPPVAAVSANPISGTTPLTVSFSSVNSSDADGTIVSYSWNFGDGTTSTEPNPVHIYNSAGTFTAVLTVTDNSGLTDTDSVVITASQAPNTAIYVNGISMSLVSNGRNTSARAVITVNDGNGAPRPNVTVTGNWSGLTTGNFTGTTNTSGQVVITSASTKKTGTFTINVTNLSASGYTYNPAQNVATSASISN